MIPQKTVSWVPILGIVGFGLLLTMPAILNSCLLGHDFEYHVVISRHFSAQFWQGELYPRWLHSMNAGFGSPTFFFYAPIPYYFTSLLSPLSHYNMSSCNELALSGALALIASGLTAYLWLKEIASKPAALIASLVYMAWPYHLAVNFYIRSAFAEYWSFVWMPLILYFSIKIVKGSPLNTIGLAIALALLSLTHLPTFVIFFPVPVGYTLLLAHRHQRRVVCVRLSVAVVLAIGLSAIYWLPAMMTQSSVSMNAMLTEALQYQNNFLFTGPKATNAKNFWRYLELLTVLTGALAYCAWQIVEKYSEVESKRSHPYEHHYWIMVALLSLFMTLPFSEWAWDVLPILKMLQFPWRFNTVLTVATVGLFALAISPLNIKSAFLSSFQVFFNNALNYSSNYSSNHFANRSLWRMVYLAAVVFGLGCLLTVIQLFPLQGKVTFWESRNTILSLSLIALLLLGISFIRKPIDFFSHKLLWVGTLLTLTLFLGSYLYSMEDIFFSRMRHLDDNQVPRMVVSLGAYEHRPPWVPAEIFKAKDLARLDQAFPKVSVDSDQASWSIKQWQPRKIIVQLKATTETELTIHQFYYPGWTAQLKSSERNRLSQRLPIHFSKLGMLQVSAPAGNHEIVITLEAIAQERIAQVISAISVVLGLILALLIAEMNRFSTV